ncbi:MAG: hypothetical protein PHC89_02795 [Candidatus Pacebacteria bacterium]|nr:hypothetical protein [Candidatus Paceibacterota bacterium]
MEDKSVTEPITSVAQKTVELMRSEGTNNIITIIKTVIERNPEDVPMAARMLFAAGGHFNEEQIPKEVQDVGKKMGLDLSFNSIRAVHFAKFLRE